MHLWYLGKFSVVSRNSLCAGSHGLWLKNDSWQLLKFQSEKNIFCNLIYFVNKRGEKTPVQQLSVSSTVSPGIEFGKKNILCRNESEYEIYQ